MPAGNAHHFGGHIDPVRLSEPLRERKQVDAGPATDLEQRAHPRRRQEPADDRETVGERAFGGIVGVKILGSEAVEMLDQVPVSTVPKAGAATRMKMKERRRSPASSPLGAGRASRFRT